MRNALPLLYSLILSLFIFSCGSQEKTLSKKEKRLNRIENLKDSLYSKEKEVPNLTVAQKLCKQMEYFVKNNPADSSTPKFLYELGGLYSNVLSNYPKAINYYKQLAKDFPEHKQAPNAMFSVAFIKEEVQKNYTGARMAYENFIERYPDHELADDAKQALKHVGKSPEEVLEEILKEKEKNSKKQDNPS